MHKVVFFHIETAELIQDDSKLTSCLFNKWADSAIMCLLEVMAIMGIPIQIKTDNAPEYVTSKIFKNLHINIESILQVYQQSYRTNSY